LRRATGRARPLTIPSQRAGENLRLTGGAFASMGDIIERGIRDARSLEEALADLLAKYETYPSADLARMIRQLQAEIGERKRPS
jgi:hypothetical protein